MARLLRGEGGVKGRVIKEKITFLKLFEDYKKSSDWLPLDAGV